MKKKVRVRFAPSPTGHLHLGGVRTAIFNWLFAQHHKGSYLIRFEDTDFARSHEKYVTSQLASLEWLGLSSAEPVVFQSADAKNHQEALDRLLANGQAYPCFCEPRSQEKLAEDNEADRGYDKTCRDKEWQDADLKKPHAIRFKVPGDMERLVFEDLIRGPIIVPVEQVEDFVLARRDGSFTYNFCVVVDDISMGITHVIRGEDHIPNTPKQVLMYTALGHYEPPQFAHLPLILGPSGNRLSKREAAVSVEEYRTRGFIAEALFNYLVRLGWSHGDQEVFSRAELIDLFTLSAVGKKAAIFDIVKLTWLNGVYMRQTPAKDLLDDIDQMEPGASTRLKDAWKPKQLHALIDLYKERCDTLRELYGALIALATPPATIDLGLIEKWNTENLSELLSEFLEKLVQQPSDDASSIQVMVKELAVEKGTKMPFLAQPLRLALTGSISSPGVFGLVAILGVEEVSLRARALLEAVGSLQVGK